MEKINITELLAKIGERQKEQKRQEYAAKVKEETDAAVEAIRAKYAKEAPAEWNESPEDKARRQLLQDLKGGRI